MIALAPFARMTRSQTFGALAIGGDKDIKSNNVLEFSYNFISTYRSNLNSSGVFCPTPPKRTKPANLDNASGTCSRIL
jgi:hypothetical protein